jgi:antibiotic biosynthesis monooxygenase (ABM) superfamily enzyme
MKVTKTITIDGSTDAEFQAIKAHLEALRAQFPGWVITYDPILKRATAVRSDDVTTL